MRAVWERRRSYYIVRMNMSTPSYTAQPIAELSTLRERRNDAPSKKPATPRCCIGISNQWQRKWSTMHTFQTVPIVLKNPWYRSSVRTWTFVCSKLLSEPLHILAGRLRTLITSNGCVASVAIAPAAAADTLCVSAASVPDLAGIIRAEMFISWNERETKNRSQASRLMPS